MHTAFELRNSWRPSKGRSDNYPPLGWRSFRSFKSFESFKVQKTKPRLENSKDKRLFDREHSSCFEFDVLMLDGSCSSNYVLNSIRNECVFTCSSGRNYIVTLTDIRTTSVISVPTIVTATHPISARANEPGAQHACRPNCLLLVFKLVFII